MTQNTPPCAGHAVESARAEGTPNQYGPDNPPRLRRPGESVETYRLAMGWDMPVELPQPVAFAMFGKTGNIRIWSTDSDPVRKLAEEKGVPLAGLVTHEQARTYGDARDAAGYARGRAESERLREALDYVIRDLEVRSHWKRGENKGVVDIGDGAYTQAKAALAGEVKP